MIRVPRENPKISTRNGFQQLLAGSKTTMETGEASRKRSIAKRSAPGKCSKSGHQNMSFQNLERRAEVSQLASSDFIIDGACSDLMRII
jgi:hypothetical protein